MSGAGVSMTGLGWSSMGFPFNVVHFREVDESRDTHRHEVTETRFKELAGKLKGDYKTIDGLDAVNSSVSGAN